MTSKIDQNTYIGAHKPKKSDPRKKRLQKKQDKKQDKMKKSHSKKTTGIKNRYISRYKMRGFEENFTDDETDDETDELLIHRFCSIRNTPEQHDNTHTILEYMLFINGKTTT
jgi:hypothetical protein